MRISTYIQHNLPTNTCIKLFECATVSIILNYIVTCCNRRSFEASLCRISTLAWSALRPTKMSPTSPPTAGDDDRGRRRRRAKTSHNCSTHIHIYVHTYIHTYTPFSLHIHFPHPYDIIFFFWFLFLFSI